jgi:hypothetical protein
MMQLQLTLRYHMLLEHANDGQLTCGNYGMHAMLLQHSQTPLGWQLVSNAISCNMMTQVTHMFTKGCILPGQTKHLMYATLATATPFDSSDCNQPAQVLHSLQLP